jgi:hypothetical protein
MIYVKSILAGLVCVFAASFLMLEGISVYLSVVHHVETGAARLEFRFLCESIELGFDLRDVLDRFLLGIRSCSFKVAHYRLDDSLSQQLRNSLLAFHTVASS